MRFIFLILSMLYTSASVAQINFDKKSGPVFGIGAIRTNYTFPSRFSGQTAKSKDEKQNLIGPVANLGYDILPLSFLLVGVRGEAYVADTLRMGNTDDKKKTDLTSGKMTGLNVTGRVGIPLKIKMFDAVEQKTHMTGELFFEAGAGKMWATMTKDYTYKKSPNESYKETITDQRLTGIMAAGFNIATISGNFLEMKVMQTRTLTNKIDFSGSEQTNGGSVVQLKDEQKKNINQGAITAFMISFGHHW